jgi:glycosyltransferase involved in cell wall biosynthesis
MRPSIKVVKLSGGLGNQLFQYCFAKSKFMGADNEVIFDISDFENGLAQRNFVLKDLGISGAFAICERHRYLANDVPFIDLVVFKTILKGTITKRRRLKSLRIVSEHSINYSTDVEKNLSGDVYVEGYWQSVRYWPDNKPKFVSSVLNQDLALATQPGLQPRDTDICAVHFRRGDYLTELNKEFHGTCDSAYYLRAMQLSEASVFHVYTDDPVLAHAVFQDLSNVQIISHAASDEIHDFQQLTLYSNLIISNSTFSYIAAYFAYIVRSARVTAPYPWYSFKDVGPDIPECWTILNRATGATPADDDIAAQLITISVIIPVHLRHEYLEEAVLSVKAQTFRPLEILLILNAASDQARETAKQLAARFDDIRIVETEIASLSGARNLGIQTAMGNFVAFLDDDDIWSSTKLERQASCAIRMTADLVATNYYKFDEHGHIYDESQLSAIRQDLWSNELSVANYLSGGSAILINRLVFDTVGYFDEGLPACEDHDMWRRIALAGYKIHFIDQCLVGYRINASNMTRDVNVMLRGELLHLAKILNEGDSYKVQASKFYLRIRETLDEHLSITDNNKFNHTDFYYLQKLKGLFTAADRHTKLKDFFTKTKSNEHPSHLIASRQFVKLVKIVFLLLPLELLSYVLAKIKLKL